MLSDRRRPALKSYPIAPRSQIVVRPRRDLHALLAVHRRQELAIRDWFRNRRKATTNRLSKRGRADPGKCRPPPKRRIHARLIIVMLVSCLSSQPARSATRRIVDEMSRKHIQARGGADKVRGFRPCDMTGKATRFGARTSRGRSRAR